MPAQSYQVVRDLRNGGQEQIEAFQLLSDLAQNAVQGYGLVIQDVSLDGAGRLRMRINQPLPQAEVDSFAGAIIAV